MSETALIASSDNALPPVLIPAFAGGQVSANLREAIQWAVDAWLLRTPPAHPQSLRARPQSIPLPCRNRRRCLRAVAAGAAQARRRLKVALYADEWGGWTHAARQLADGWWTSKLGPAEDILHRTPSALVGVVYGEVREFMKRAKS